MNYKKIGKKIADKRTLLGITQEDLAEKVANELQLSLDFLFSDELQNLDTSKATNKEITEMIDILNKDEKQMANIFIKNIVKGLIELRENNK